MKYFDVHGKKFSAMTLGTVQLGMDYGIANTYGQPTVEESYDMLAHAIAGGVTVLDTSHDYGTSEEVIGGFLKSPKCVQKPHIVTKFNVHAEAGSPAAAVEKEIITSVETSMDKLGLKKLDCVLAHSGTDLMNHREGTLAAFERMLKEGYADFVGTSVYNPAEVSELLKYDMLTAIQVPMSVFDQKMIHGGDIERLRQKGVAVFVRSVFLQGLAFLDPDNTGKPELDKYAAPYIRKLRAAAERSGMSVAQFCISYIRDLPGVVSLVLGAETCAQVTQNIGLLDGPSIAPEARERLNAEFVGIDFPNIMEALQRKNSRQVLKEKEAKNSK